MVRVDQYLMLAIAQLPEPLDEVVERDVVVARISPCRFEPQARIAENPDAHDRDSSEPDQRWQLHQLVDRQVTDSENGDAVRAVPLTVTLVEDSRAGAAAIDGAAGGDEGRRASTAPRRDTRRSSHLAGPPAALEAAAAVGRTTQG